MLQAFAKLHRFYQGFESTERCLEQTIGRSPCMSGCGRCCEVNTTKMMTIEALNAVSIITGLGKLDAVLSVAEGWLLERHGEAPSYEGMLAGCFVPPKIRAEFEALSRLPCPFLTEAKSCLIYEARPMVCRAYGVTISHEGACPRPPGRGETLTQFMYMKVPALHDDIIRFKQGLERNHPEWKVFGFSPTLLYRAGREKKFRRMVKDNQIASAKIIGTQVDLTLMWQPQLEALQKGVAPDLVLDPA